MNLKLASVVIALSLPLAGCGNKGPLVLSQNPPPEDAPMLPMLPSMSDALPLEGVPEDSPPIPTTDGAPADPPATPPATPPVPAASDNGNG